MLNVPDLVRVALVEPADRRENGRNNIRTYTLSLTPPLAAAALLTVPPVRAVPNEPPGPSRTAAATLTAADVRHPSALLFLRLGGNREPVRGRPVLGSLHR